MRRAVYPGSFDPVTFGHLDIIRRSAGLVDELIIGVLVNHAKTPLFSAEERVNMLKDVTKNLPNVRVESFSGLSVDFLEMCNARFIVRGLRAITDFEYELQMAQTNRIMSPGIDTIFLTTSLEYAYLSSTTVKEVALYGGDISRFVPGIVADKIAERVSHIKKAEKTDNIS
jgi:pantetheine-phosphate adenylyltransferase